MSVYTRVTEDDLRALLAEYSIGELEDFRGITAGITNTNYFVDTSTGRWVLTLFEQMDNGSLPFFMQLMDHLAGHGVPGAHPVARNDGGFLSRVQNRPAALVYRLAGASIETPEAGHCASLGGVVAEKLAAELDERCCAALTWQGNAQANEIAGKYGTDSLIASPLIGGRVFTQAEYFDFTTALSTSPRSAMQDRGLSAEIDWQISDTLTLVSVSSLRKFEKSFLQLLLKFGISSAACLFISAIAPFLSDFSNAALYSGTPPQLSTVSDSIST